MSEFNKLIFVPNMSRLSLKDCNFLIEKGVFETAEYSSIIMLFSSEEKHFLLSSYLSEKHFFVHICRKHKSWPHFYNKNRKK
jgi:hypothetical protein